MTDEDAPAEPRQKVRARPDEERDRLAESIADRLDKPMTALGLIFLFLVLAETVTDPRGALSTAYTAAGWVIWGAFVAEFALRLYVAPSAVRFLRRNWWQLIFLALPFLRFLRVVARLRLRPLIRGGRVLSSAVRGTRTAGRNLTGRAAWLAATTVIVVLAASQLLFEFAVYGSYAEALHDAAFAAVTGQPLVADGGFARVTELVLAVYSVVVFAALAGMLGAYFLERRPGADDASGSMPVAHSSSSVPAAATSPPDSTTT
jgi:voltage-gated potassium channel